MQDKCAYVTHVNTQCAGQCKGFTVENVLDKAEDTEVRGQSTPS